MADVKIVQVVVEVDGELCAVFLPPVHTETLVPMIAALSDGPIKLVKLPGIKMVPLSELTEVPHD